MPAPDRVRAEIAALGRLVPGPPLDVDRLEVTGSATFTSAFDVDTIAVVSTGAAVLAAGYGSVDRDIIVGSFVASVMVDGSPLPTWADPSGSYR